MVKQRPVFFQIYIKPDQVEAVTKLLNSGGNPSPPDGFFSFAKMKSVHFARWLVVPALRDIKASIIYSANVDGSVANHLDELVDMLTNDLDQILSHCIGYPSGNSLNRESRLSYLKGHSLSTPGFYVGAPNRTVEQIHNEAKLHTAVRDFVKEHGHEWKTSRKAYDAIKEFLAADHQWDWAREKYSLPKKKILKMILFVLFVLAILPWLILLILLIHFFYERKAKPFGVSVNQLPLEHLAELKDQEDIIYQNQLSQVCETKGGLRKLGLHFFLWSTNFLASNWLVHGELLGTPTIHFARWVLIDGGKRFVFFSNFDGSFDEYLGDFVDNSGWGLNAIYGASKGYPRTSYVFLKGAYNISEFMGWGRKTQIPTAIWYSAYPWYGLQQIVSKTELRTELFNSGQLNEAEIKEMLRRI
ncbi:MAG: hypothetical protein JKY54_05345 [Flavobacteriales bacterium]|nr:hypothetical protein [Flavobacteriales bacterium]